MAKARLSNQTAEKLLAAARDAKTASYSPYSGFRVGAAVLVDGNEIVTGTNIENASYGLTCCAERVAIFSAMVRVSGDKSKLQAIALSCGDSEDLPENSLMPCGACRQVMVELFDPKTPVIIDGLQRTTLQKLLPKPFKI